MNKINRLLLAGVAIVISFGVSQAQSEYVKFNKDVNPQGTNIKFFKDEIYVLLKELPQDSTETPYTILVGDKEYSLGKSVDKLNDGPQDKSSQKNSFIKIDRQNGLIHIDITSISEKGISLVTEHNERIPIEQKVIDIEQQTTGDAFRLIIPNAITLSYRIDDLMPYESSAFPWWYYALGGLVLIMLLFAVWRFLIRKRFFQKREVIVVQYGENKSLPDFARDYGMTLDELLKMNKKIIDKKYKSYDKKNMKTVERELKGKSLKVRVKKNNALTISGNGSEYKDNNVADATNSPPENASMNNDILIKLQQINDNIIEKIQQLKVDNNTSDEIIAKFEEDISDLKNKNKKLEEAKEKIESENKTLETEKSSLQEQLRGKTSDHDKLSSEIEEIKKRVIVVDYLKGDADSIYSYLKFCQQVSAKAYSSYNRINPQNQDSGVGLLLLNFQTAVNSIPVGNWLQIVQDIKETGVSINKDLIRSFSQIQTDSEKQREFKRLLYNEVLVKYSSNLLILAEAFRNVSRLHVSPEHISDIQSTFEKYVVEIVNKAKTVGMEIKYVPLFTNCKEYMAQIESMDKERSLAYRNIDGLKKDEIAEIVSYGVKTIFDDSRTYVILA